MVNKEKEEETLISHRESLTPPPYSLDAWTTRFERLELKQIKIDNAKW